MAACAADAGDSAKSDNLTTPGGDSALPPGVDAAPGSEATTPPPPPPGDGGSSILDSTSPGDTSLPPPGDSSLPPPSEGGGTPDTSPPDDSAPVETGPPPDDGGGCSAGSTIITATDPSTGSTAGTAGNFGTTGAVCVKVMGGIVSMYGGWNSSNVTGRTVTLNGTTVPVGGAQGAVPAGPDGYAIWEWSAGADSYASMSLY